MSIQRKDMHPSTLNIILDYLSAELKEAQNTGDLNQILGLLKALLLQTPMQNAVVGVGNIRVEMDPSTMAQARNENACTVKLLVPSSLSNAFEDLSCRMRHLQDKDPETFANASNALHWLANGELHAN